MVTSQNVDKPKRGQPRRWQTETSTNQNVIRIYCLNFDVLGSSQLFAHLWSAKLG